LEGAWLQSLEDIINLLNNRAERVELKGKRFQCPPPASKEDIQGFESEVQQRIDPTIIPGKYTMKDLKNCEDYKRFIERHCVEGTYIFQVNEALILNFACSEILEDCKALIFFTLKFQYWL
jgi:DMSO/TMAO reductase YedYZ molybdopterin-dependent catalytic subunit